MNVQAVFVAVIVLWLVVIVMAFVIYAMVRQIGVLHERLGPAGALSFKNGLKIGGPAPVVQVEDVNGNALTIGTANEQGRSTLVFFFSPSCPVCKELMPTLRASAKSEGRWLDLVLAGDGAVADHVRIVSEQGLQQVPLTVSTKLGLAFHVGKLPYAVLINESGRLMSAGLMNSREHLESLYEAKERGVPDLQTYLEEMSSGESVQRPQ